MNMGNENSIVYKNNKSLKIAKKILMLMVFVLGDRPYIVII